MQKSQKGFTLIELVVVIVLLGILGVTALGKYQDLAGDAQDAVNEGVAAELAAASAINYAASVVGTPDLAVLSTTQCDGLGALFQAGSIPTTVTLAAVVTGCAGSGTTGSCSVTGSGTPAGNPATATIICTGP